VRPLHAAPRSDAHLDRERAGGPPQIAGLHRTEEVLRLEVRPADVVGHREAEACRGQRVDPYERAPVLRLRLSLMERDPSQPELKADDDEPKDDRHRGLGEPLVDAREDVAQERLASIEMARGQKLLGRLSTEIEPFGRRRVPREIQTDLGGLRLASRRGEHVREAGLQRARLRGIERA